MVTVSLHSSTNPNEVQGGCGGSAPTVLACHARKPDVVSNAAQHCTTLYVAAWLRGLLAITAGGVEAAGSGIPGHLG